jgi:threonine synthase
VYGGESTLPAVTANTHWLGSVCVLCGRDHPPQHRGFVCSGCGPDGILDPYYDYAQLAAADPRALFGEATAGGMWRFAPLLPVRPTAAHGAWTLGDTPVHRADRLAAHLGLKELLLKDDTCLPSGSLKDRAAAVAIAHARSVGARQLACASTGNAAASLAVLGARAGSAVTIYVPASAPRPKLAQLVLHGARVITVDGTYDQAFDLSLAAIAENGWYSRNCAHNSLLAEGKKTAGFELAARLTAGFTRAEDTLPDVVFVSVGDGCIVSATGKAFAELETLGLIGKVPRIIGVQAAGASPLATAWAAHANPAGLVDGAAIMAAIRTAPVRTIADSICVGVPRNRVKAWRRVAASGGAFISVDDAAITAAVGLMARLAGVFAEPSAAAALAGVPVALQSGLISRGDRVAVLVTGHGLKDPEAGLQGVSLPDPIPPAADRN